MIDSFAELVNLNIDTDQYIYRYIVEPITPYFKSIHPNYVTIASLPLSFAVFCYRVGDLWNNLFVLSMLMLRIVFDCLDGHLARHYNRSSKLGAILDSISDITHSSNMLGYFWYVWVKVYTVYFWILSFLIMILIMKVSDVLDDHDRIQKVGILGIGTFMRLAKYNAMSMNIAIFGFMVWLT